MVNPTNRLIVFVFFCTLVFFFFFHNEATAQDLSSYSETELEVQLSEAVASQDYKSAANIKEELESRLSFAEKAKQLEVELDQAVHNQNFDLAASIKERLVMCRQIDSLEQRIGLAVKKQDFEHASTLKGEKEKLIQKYQAVNTSKVSGEEQSQNNLEIAEIKEYNFSTTKPISGLVEPSEGKSVVYFVAGMGGGMIPKYECFAENQYIGYIKQKRYVRYECEPGKHLFWVSSENKEFLTADLLPNRTYVVRVAFVIGAWKAHTGFRIEHDEKDLKKIQKYLQKDEALHFTKEHIEEKNREFKNFINANLKRYENETKDRYNFKHLEANMYYR